MAPIAISSTAAAATTPITTSHEEPDESVSGGMSAMMEVTSTAASCTLVDAEARTLASATADR